MKIPCHTNHRPSSENRARGPLKQELRSLWRCCARQKKIAWLFTTSRQCTLHNLSLSAASRDFNQNQHSFTVFTRPSPALLLQSMSQDGAWAGFLCSALLPCGLQTGSLLCSAPLWFRDWFFALLCSLVVYRLVFLQPISPSLPPSLLQLRVGSAVLKWCSFCSMMTQLQPSRPSRRAQPLEQPCYVPALRSKRCLYAVGEVEGGAA